MEPKIKDPSFALDDETALRMILEGTSSETGEGFFKSLVENLARALNTHAAWVTEYLEETKRLRALAFWLGGKWIHGFEHPIGGTPCEVVIKETRLVHYPDRVLELFPKDKDEKFSRAVSYMGVPLKDLDGRILGHLAVMDIRPMPEGPRNLALFQIFAARAAAELQRLRAESDVREREELLGRLVDSAMDGILKLDQNLNIVMMNSAAQKIFKCVPLKEIGKGFSLFLEDEDQRKFSTLIHDLEVRPEGERYLWIPGGLKVIGADGIRCMAEATVSRFEMQRRTFYTLILRNVNDRIEAEQKIQSLSHEAEYLREEIKALLNIDKMVGQSGAFLHILRDAKQVAETDSTVLILGETGTGKEVIARAIHAASRRREKPLIKVNCAAIPTSLIESELFGHEKGAFTGATAKREGRFALANGGTIFLDEIGELPIDLQVKLLRVLQEGEFEPVGSSKTVKVDIRVLAATNRDLEKAIQEGKFREDLFYRLNVFPIHLPPLRERLEDIPLLAETFAKRFCQKMGRTFEPFSKEHLERLQAYPWPGNVRELQNIIERAVITSPKGPLNLDRALPENSKNVVPESGGPEDKETPRIRTAEEMLSLERKNIQSALDAAGGRVSGKNGAAQLLGMNPSTLTSRMKALGIKRP